MAIMHDAATITLIILTLALLRGSLLTSPDAAPGIRDEEESGITVRVPVIVEADRPQSARRGEAGR